MIVQGSAGNISPKYYKASFTPIDGQGEEYVNCEHALENMAQEVSEKVESIFDTIYTKRGMRVDAYSKYILLQSKIPNMIKAHKIADEAMKHCGINGQKWIEKIESFHKKGISFKKNIWKCNIFILEIGAYVVYQMKQ